MAGEEYTREYLQYGGQAIPEGVMMRSPRYFSVACRAPNGIIVSKTEAVEKTWIGRQKWLKWPFLRGSLALLDSLALGSRAMKFATKIQMDDEYQPIVEPKPGEEAVETEPAMSPKIQDATIATTLFIGMALGIVIFDVVPNSVAEFFGGRFHVPPIGRNMITECTKIVLFIGYMALIGRMPEIHRIFCYHGAEHKAINTLEAGQELEFKNCTLQTRLHPRCGTSFAVILLILSLLVYTFIPRYPIPHLPTWENIIVRCGVELAILPFIAGVAYEFLRFAGKFRNSTFVMICFKPGLWTQLLTTQEPDEDQIEVALIALRQVIASEEAGHEVEYEPIPKAVAAAEAHAG